MKVVTIVGARPQFIKAAPVSRELRKNHTEILVHTGQHYDRNMSEVFFEQLGIPRPDHNLGVGSAPHGQQTAAMLAGIETILLGEKPDWVLVYGDTNSTLAGALAAAKLNIPAAHVEAGLRSCDRAMPEEINRLVTDQLSSVLFCPTEASVGNLRREGFRSIINDGKLTKDPKSESYSSSLRAIDGILMQSDPKRIVVNVGDVMLDALTCNISLADNCSCILGDLSLQPKTYVLATVHRSHNTDDPDILKWILKALESVDQPVIFPLHPRTRERMKRFGLYDTGLIGVRFLDPVGYLEILMLTRNASAVITDSGGLQKEAYLLAVPCITLRPATEWVETVGTGWNTLVEPGAVEPVLRVPQSVPAAVPPPVYGDGSAAIRIVQWLELVDAYYEGRKEAGLALAGCPAFTFRPDRMPANHSSGV